MQAFVLIEAPATDITEVLRPIWEAGVECDAFYTSGPNDIILLMEAHNEETIAQTIQPLLDNIEGVQSYRLSFIWGSWMNSAATVPEDVGDAVRMAMAPVRFAGADRSDTVPSGMGSLIPLSAARRSHPSYAGLAQLASSGQAVGFGSGLTELGNL